MEMLHPNTDVGKVGTRSRQIIPRQPPHRNMALKDDGSPREQTSRSGVRRDGLFMLLFVGKAMRKRNPGGCKPGILVVRRPAKH